MKPADISGLGSSRAIAVHARLSAEASQKVPNRFLLTKFLEISSLVSSIALLALAARTVITAAVKPVVIPLTETVDMRSMRFGFHPGQMEPADISGLGSSRVDA